MPRGRLDEKTVQDVAVARLVQHYKDTRPEFVAVTSDSEVTIKNGDKLGWGRADGLVTAALADRSIFTASVEAKSWRTLHNINLSNDDDKWIVHALLFGIILAVTSAFLGWFYTDHWFWYCISPIFMFFITTSAFLIVTRSNKYYRKIDVVKQVKHYPANELWIALSTDAFNSMSKESQDQLLKDIEKGGIGFLRVSSRSKVFIEKVPRYEQSPKGYDDFLCCYYKDSDIRARLKRKPGVSLAQESEQ